MDEKYNETQNSKENTIETIKDDKDIKDEIDNKLNKKNNNKIFNYLLIIYILVTAGSIFKFIYFLKIKSHNMRIWIISTWRWSKKLF